MELSQIKSEISQLKQEVQRATYNNTLQQTQQVGPCIERALGMFGMRLNSIEEANRKQMLIIAITVSVLFSLAIISICGIILFVLS